MALTSVQTPSNEAVRNVANVIDSISRHCSGSSKSARIEAAAKVAEEIFSHRKQLLDSSSRDALIDASFRVIKNIEKRKQRQADSSTWPQVDNKPLPPSTPGPGITGVRDTRPPSSEFDYQKCVDSKVAAGYDREDAMRECNESVGPGNYRSSGQSQVNLKNASTEAPAWISNYYRSELSDNLPPAPTKEEIERELSETKAKYETNSKLRSKIRSAATTKGITQEPVYLQNYRHWSKGY